jgi:hypothetical protein
MLISKEEKLLFIHIQKTGGRSIAKVLKQEIPDVTEVFGTHDFALRARSALRSEYSQLSKLAFVRNPWDRLVSWYVMIRQREMVWPRRRLFRLWQYALDHSTSFEEFVLNCTETIHDVDGKKSFWYNQLDYLTDDNGQLIVDFVGKYETLERDAKEVFRTLGLNDVEIPHVGKSQRSHYSEYYSDRTKNIVAERYSRDIEFFGYVFDTPTQL